MKRTLITLLALAGMAVAAEPQSWDLKVYTKSDGTKGDTLVNQSGYLGNADFYFDTKGTVTGDILSSYVFDFKATTLNEYAAGNSGYAFTLFSTSRGNAAGSLRYGLSLYSTAGNSADSVTVGIYSGAEKTTTNTDGSVSTSTEYTNLSDSTITISKNDVVSFAYDSISKTALVYNATKKTWLEASNITDNEAYYFESGANTNGQMVGASAVYSQGKKHLLNFGKITDLSSFNGNVAEIKNYMMTVPEPTTATLSLLALAGLAARRRRK